jgi:hypothetical protein
MGIPCLFLEIKMHNTILEIANEALEDIQQTTITSINAKTPQAVLVKSIANRIANRIFLSYEWQVANRFMELQVAKGTSEISLGDIDNFDSISTLALYDKNTYRSVPQVSVDEYAIEKATAITPLPNFIISENKIKFNKPWEYDTTLIFFYKAHTPVIRKDAEGKTVYDSRFKEDSDKFALADEMLICGIASQIMKHDGIAGFDLKEQEFGEIVKHFQNKDTQNKTISLNDGGDSRYRAFPWIGAR